MTYDYQIILGVIAAIVGLVGYVPYYRDIFRGTTKPHPFSWLGFALLTGISFFAQIFSGAGPGAWVSGVSAFAILGIAILALVRGHKRITIFDWICFGGALFGIVLWQITSDPLFAVIIVTITDTIAFAPTYRKGYINPFEETASLYTLSALKYAIGLFALTTFNWTTALFPASLVISNAIFVLLLLKRRRDLARASIASNG